MGDYLILYFVTHFVVAAIGWYCGNKNGYDEGKRMHEPHPEWEDDAMAVDCTISWEPDND